MFDANDLMNTRRQKDLEGRLVKDPLRKQNEASDDDRSMINHTKAGLEADNISAFSMGSKKTASGMMVKEGLSGLSHVKPDDDGNYNNQ